MFAIINTNGANLIAINIPHDGADKSLPALAAMLEKNATFIQQGYQELKTVTPSMSITLGDTFRCDSYGLELAIATENGAAVLGESFTVASPEVFASNKAELAKKEADLQKLRTELSFVRQQLVNAQERIEFLEKSEVTE